MTDTLIRLLEHQDYGVSYVQNLTDIDDAILREARRVGFVRYCHARPVLDHKHLWKL
jgi:cysteinyl-tRNA synthetase